MPEDDKALYTIGEGYVMCSYTLFPAFPLKEKRQGVQSEAKKE